MSSRQQSHDALTIGELFPAEDLVGQWVFSVTALCEDLMATTRWIKYAQSHDDHAGYLTAYRNLITRLFEARRLVMAAESHADVASFASKLLTEGLTGVNLRAAYVREEGESESTVEALYAELRHTTVHYKHIGSPELAKALFNRRRFPAELEIKVDKDNPQVWWKWVHVVSGMEIFGEPRDDWLRHIDGRGKTAANIAAAWLAIPMVAVPVYAHRRGIDLGRLGKFPTPPAG